MKVKNDFSGEREVRKGVAQRSVLEPIQFFLYLNDLCFGNFNWRLTAFADDTAFLCVSKNLSAMNTAVEQNLRNLKFWLWKNKIFLNVQKTKYV